MNEMKVFDNQEFGKIRTVTIEDELWFVGKDVADALGYENPQKAVRTHVDEEDRGVTKMDTPGGMQNVAIINEPGLYALILGSKLERAKRFKHWVTSEVFPALRNIRWDNMVENVGNNEIQTLTSMEVAQMVGKEHKKLLRDIRVYCGQLDGANIGLVDFFKESTYVDGKGESRPCFMVTKKGCEFIAHKLTGQKGTEFTARYINRFHEIENKIDGVAELEISTAQIQKLMCFIESHQQFMESQEKFNQMMINKLENPTCSRIQQSMSHDADCFSAFIGEKDEKQMRRENLNRLVDEMAVACNWDKKFALHRMYKTLEQVLAVSLDEYMRIYQTETGNVCASTWKVVTDSDRLYKTAVILCRNTIDSMKC